MPTRWPSEKFTPRASGPSINGKVRLRGHTGSMTRRSTQARQTKAVRAGTKWPSSGALKGGNARAELGRIKSGLIGSGGANTDQPCCRNQLKSNAFRPVTKKYCGGLAGARFGSRAKPPLPHQAACALTARTIAIMDSTEVRTCQQHGSGARSTQLHGGGGNHCWQPPDRTPARFRTNHKRPHFQENNDEEERPEISRRTVDRTGRR